MRITFILSQGLEEPSAVGRHYPLAKELARLGHQVNVIALHPRLDTIPQRRLVRDGVNIYFAGQMHVYKDGSVTRHFSAPRLLRVTLSSMLNVARYALTIPTDVYHLCKAQPVNGAGVLLAKIFRHKRLFIDCDDYETEINTYSGKWQKPIMRLFEDNLQRFARGLTVNTHFAQDRYAALGFPRERIVYVPNGIDRDRFDDIDAAQVEALRERLNLAGKIVISYIGTLNLFHHPVDLLIEAFVDVHRAIPNARLLLVGGGMDFEEVEQQVRELNLGDAIRLIGKVPSEEVKYYFALSELTVDPVEDDEIAAARSPIKIFESLALGVPVVTSAIGDRAEWLAGAGMMVQPGDVAALGNGIIAALQDRERMAELRRNALELRERYYWDMLARDFVRVYNL